MLVVSNIQLVGNQQPETPNVLIMSTNQSNTLGYEELSSLANELEKPIVICSEVATEITISYEKTAITMDLETGETTEEFVGIEYETQYEIEYSVIEPGNSIRIEIFSSTELENSIYLEALESEITSLKEIPSSHWKQKVQGHSVIADYDGDASAWDLHGDWQETWTREISALDNGNDWTYETTYQYDIWRSVPDVYTNKRTWMFEWGVSHLIDSLDYKNDIWNQWCGPWVHERYIKNAAHSYGNANEELWEWAPQTATGSTTYQISESISAPAALSMGIQKQWNEEDVTITATSSQASDYTRWYETFIDPSYEWWPLSYEPCLAARTGLQSYRGSKWRVTYTDLYFESRADMKTTVKYDDGFFWVFFPFVVGYYRYTTYVSNTEYINTYAYR